MRLSSLQKYILLKGYFKKSKIFRQVFLKFYEDQTNKPREKDQTNIITKSLERLINRELVIGYGIRTPHKWFIKEIKLTSKGRKLAKKLLGEQQRLPL